MRIFGEDAHKASIKLQLVDADREQVIKRQYAPNKLLSILINCLFAIATAAVLGELNCIHYSAHQQKHTLHLPSAFPLLH